MSDEGALKAENEREAIENELLERRDAALSQVVKFGDPVLEEQGFAGQPISMPRSARPRSSA